MLNGVFVTVTLLSVFLAATTGQMEALTSAIITSAQSAVELAIGLIGVMALFLGLMRVAENAGLMTSIAKGLSPVMCRLFPGIPADSPAMSAMILNISANILGLGNAATPFGIRAIEELDKYNTKPGTATNAMVLFLAINTAGLAVLPTGMIGIRASLGSIDAAGILFPTWFASGMATLVAITAAFLLARTAYFKKSEPAVKNIELPTEDSVSTDDARSPQPVRVWIGRIFWLLFFAFAYQDITSRSMTEPLADVIRATLSFWLLPALFSVFVLYGWVRQVQVYDSVVDGAKQGFEVALRIIPYLVAIIVMVGMFRASGGLELLIQLVSPITLIIGMPAEVLPVALLRPLTGSGALGVAAETIQANGPDTFIGYFASTVYGSTETTFYVLAVYFGAVGIRNTRHALPACLLADTAGILAATFIVNMLFG